MGRFEFLDDVALADCAIELRGHDRGDLFETAAAALAEVMVDPATLSLTVDRDVEVDAETLDLLLYDWLSELIFLKDRDREVFPWCDVRIDGDGGPFRLRAHLRGGAIDPEQTALRADPKAVTFHRLAVEREDAGWKASVVIDI